MVEGRAKAAAAAAAAKAAVGPSPAGQGVDRHTGRRFLALWLPYWPTDCRYRRWRRQAGRGPEAAAPMAAAPNQPPIHPLVLTGAVQGGVRLLAVDAAAAAEGLRPGMTLADARALVPHLHSLDAAASAGAGDAAALAGLADWCGRYTPWAAPDGEDGIALDITGCAHLFGGEAALLDDLCDRLRRAGITAHGAIADTPGAAWAWARFGGGRVGKRREEAVLPPGGARAALAPLPLAALRLPVEAVSGLGRLGLRKVGDLLPLPRGPLAARFGSLVLRRLDQAFGRDAEPISPRFPPAPWRVRLDFAEPIATRPDIDHACRRLLDELCARLAREGRGARRLVLACYRVDGGVQRLTFGTSRPVRDPAHLMRLLAERLETVEPGFGLETLLLEAAAADPLAPTQTALAGSIPAQPGAVAEADLAALVDRLQNRLGRDRVVQILPRDSHVPERASRRAPALVAPAPVAPGRADWDGRPPRPFWLLPCPEVIEPVPIEPVPIEQDGAEEEGADAVPRAFRWRRLVHRVAWAEGPERIEPEWWRQAGPGRSSAGRRRDYYRLEDAEGRRFWVYRDGPPAHAQGDGDEDGDRDRDRDRDRDGDRVPAPARWYLHGLFP